MKTEVVLKYHRLFPWNTSKPFNENRSCIEICSAFLPLFVPLSLMKTEVVLKSGMSQKDFDRLGV